MWINGCWTRSRNGFALENVFLPLRDAHWGHLFFVIRDSRLATNRFPSKPKRKRMQWCALSMCQKFRFSIFTFTHIIRKCNFNFNFNFNITNIQYLFLTTYINQLSTYWQATSMHLFCSFISFICTFKIKIFRLLYKLKRTKEKSKTLFSHPKTGWFICSQFCSCDGRVLESIQFSIGIGGSCEILYHLVGCLAIGERTIIQW